MEKTSKIIECSHKPNLLIAILAVPQWLAHSQQQLEELFYKLHPLR